MASTDLSLVKLENENVKVLSTEMRYSTTAHNSYLTWLRKKSRSCLGLLLTNLQKVFLGTKLSVLFPIIPLAIIAQCYDFGRPWIFALSLLGLIPLAERLSFLTEQIAFFTGARVGGLLNVTCGNSTELIIAIFALSQHKIDVVKYSLLGSILSNLLLVPGISLLCGGIAHLGDKQNYDRRQANLNLLLLVLALLCYLLPLLFRYAGASVALTADPTLHLSRASSIIMLIAYFGYIIFRLWTHHQLFEAQEKEDGSKVNSEEVPESSDLNTSFGQSGVCSWY